MQIHSETDLFLLPDNEPFIVREASLDHLIDSPVRVPHAIIILCLKGSGKVSVNFEKYTLKQNSQLFLLPQSIFALNSKSDDLQTLCISFSLSMFNEAFFLIDSELFAYLVENALYDFPPEIFQEKEYFFKSMQFLFHDRENKFRNKIAINYLQSYFLDTFDKIKRDKTNLKTKEANRKKELFRKFVQSVHKNYTRNREVNFYANELSISTRYLSSITQSVDNSTAKEFIDNCVVQEIKLLLQTSGLSIQEISDRLNFPDQSNLGRFFKRKTGLSPASCREKQ